MAKKTVENNNKMVIGVFAALALVVVVVVVVLLIMKSGGVLGGGLDDDYFVSDGTKYVINLDEDTASFSNGDLNPTKTHMVYYYSGEKVTGVKTFYEYEDEEKAKSAFDMISEEYGADVETKLNGKYVEVILNSDAYQDMTVEDVKRNIEFYEMIMSTDDGSSRYEVFDE